MLQSDIIADRETIVFLHGNASSSIFWKDTMERIEDDYNVIAPDLRGYGKTEDLLIDATQGFSDQTEDVISLLDHLGIERFHVAGHSMGGGVVYSLIVNYGTRILSATLVNPVSPYGFGGTKGVNGEPIRDDFSGTGAGTVNPEFARRIETKDRSEEDENSSPRLVMNKYFWKPPFRAPNEEELLDGVLEEKIGEKKYPGDKETSKNWPGFSPGVYGPVNAASPKYLSGLAENIIQSSPKPPILWVRGTHDNIVSDESHFDIGVLGNMGLIEGYPGTDKYPAQPMVSQTRKVLQEYEKESGSFREALMENTGHTPFIEQPEVFLEQFLKHVKVTS
ncbi:MAG: alpha/beta hydrolase [Gracilimonas sp.]|nr:alpha/beta hydrolase [Gracilimonas sp.]